MKRLIVLSAVAASLMTSACITVIDAEDGDGVNWSGQNAQPFDAARDGCVDSVGDDSRSRAFAACMAEKGWTRDDR